MEQKSEISFDFERSLADEKLASFKGYRTDHVSLKWAYEQACHAIYSKSSQRLVVIAGPTGVGKSTLAARLKENVEKHFAKLQESHKHAISVIQVNAPAPNGVAFDWKDWYIRALEQLREPMIDKKIHIQRQLALIEGGHCVSDFDGKGSAALLRSLENGLRNREVKVLIVDEAHHMFLAKDRWKQRYSFDKIKTLAIETGVVIVLLGTYDLLDVRDHSAELVRRSEIIHFPRYACRSKEDRANFQGAVLALQKKLPMRSIPNLLKMAGFLHLKSCGLVGILKDWLSAALEIHLVEGAAFDRALLERCAESNIGMRTIFAEAICGEAKMKDIPVEDLRSLVYAKRPATAATAKSEGEPVAKRRDVGVRSPKRDAVGGLNA